MQHGIAKLNADQLGQSKEKGNENCLDSTNNSRFKVDLFIDLNRTKPRFTKQRLILCFLTIK